MDSHSPPLGDLGLSVAGVVGRSMTMVTAKRVRWTIIALFLPIALAFLCVVRSYTRANAIVGRWEIISVQAADREFDGSTIGNVFELSETEFAITDENGRHPPWRYELDTSQKPYRFRRFSRDETYVDEMNWEPSERLAPNSFRFSPYNLANC